MKKFNTEYMSNQKADFEELKEIIENLFTKESEEWISIFDTSKKNLNYIQVHSDIGILDDINPVIKFITSVLHYDTNAMEERDFYLIEYRKYENEKDFKHYRAFFDKSESIISYFEKYLNDEEIDTEKWIDVTKEFAEYDLLVEELENKLVYSKKNEEDFFKKIEELTDKNQFLTCIEALESIPQEERDYRINYELARAYQNFAIIGENEKGIEFELGSELLLTSISILESVRAEGENKVKWNMRMAYGYQYLEDKEELAIPYALRWAELDPSDKDALLVVEECKEKIKNRMKKHLLIKAYEVVESILKSHNIISFNDYWDRDSEELDVIDEEIREGLNDYKLDEEDIMDVIDNLLEDLEKSKKNKNGGNNMEKINHEFFGELDLVNGLDDSMGFSNDVVVLWEEDVNDINTTLWYGKPTEITTELLDNFTKFLQNFDEYNIKAKKALEEYLLEDNEYIKFHREEVELDLPKDARQFTESMEVTNIGLWADGDNVIIVDYMISPEDTDEILAVKFDDKLDIVDIAWES